MADELDDRLRDLARDAEPLVVLAGPQAARARGERRRARRRAAAAGVTAALALAVGGWQLLPRLEAGTDTGAVTPARSATVPLGPAATALQDRLDAELLPAGSLPSAAKWQWTVMTPEKAAKSPPPCDVAPSAVPSAQATRAYLAQRTSAVANYRLAAYADAGTAAGEAAGLRKLLWAACGLPRAGSTRGPGGSMRFAGASTGQPGVTVWVENQGPYVAVLFLTTPGDPKSEFLHTGVDKCIVASLARLAPRTPPATGHPPSATAGTAGGSGTGNGAGEADAEGKATGFAGKYSSDSC